MKRIKHIILLALIANGLVLGTASARLKVFACEPEWAALASELGGANIKAFAATHGRQDPHYIQARPSLIAKLRNADLLVCTGADLEIGWLPVLLRKAGNKAILPGQPGYFMATSFVPLLDKPQVLDRSEGDVHAAGNPHIQTDPRRIATVAKALSERLQQLDPRHASDYQQRYADFAGKWQQAITDWQARAAPLRGENIIVHHKSWVYLEDWLRLHEVATLEPKPGVPPTASHLSQLLQITARQPVMAIIYAAYQNPKSAQWLSAKTGIPAVQLPFTVGGTDKATDLFALFDETVNALLAAHGQQSTGTDGAQQP